MLILFTEIIHAYYKNQRKRRNESCGEEMQSLCLKKIIHTVPTVLVNGYVHSGQISTQFKRFEEPSSITQFLLSVYKVTDDMFYFCPVTAYNTQDTGPDCFELCPLVLCRDCVSQETDTPITL
jgi:hypothetical protein